MPDPKPVITAEAMALARDHLFASDEQFMLALSEALLRQHHTATAAERVAVMNQTTAEHVKRVDAADLAAARAEGAKAERSRIASILRAPEAEGQRKAAEALALDGDTPAAVALEALRGLPRNNTAANPPLDPEALTGALRTADAPGGLVIIDASGNATLADTPPISISPADPPKAGADRIAAMWKSTIERLNAEGGAKAATG